MKRLGGLAVLVSLLILVAVAGSYRVTPDLATAALVTLPCEPEAPDTGVIIKAGTEAYTTGNSRFVGHGAAGLARLETVAKKPEVSDDEIIKVGTMANTQSAHEATPHGRTQVVERLEAATKVEKEGETKRTDDATMQVAEEDMTNMQGTKKGESMKDEKAKAQGSKEFQPGPKTIPEHEEGISWDALAAAARGTELSDEELRLRRKLWPLQFVAPAVVHGALQDLEVPAALPGLPVRGMRHEVGDQGKAEEKLLNVSIADQVQAPDVHVDAVQGEASDKDKVQIEKDIGRAWPQHMKDKDKDSLRRVLRAYAAANPSVGYCQGMNQIAAVFILLGFDDVTALRGLFTMTQKVCPGYHGRDFAGYHLDVGVLRDLAPCVLPAKTWRSLEELESEWMVTLEGVVAEHLLSLASHSASQSWPLAATARLWDLFLLQGPRAVLASTLALLKLYLLQGKEDEGPELFLNFRVRVVEELHRDGGIALVAEVRKLLDLPDLSQANIEALRRRPAGGADASACLSAGGSLASILSRIAAVIRRFLR